MPADKLEIIPLGGVGFFGMNMMAMRCGGEAIIIDAGMGFPEADIPGVDIVIPDFSFIDQYAEEISAIILTHGHEDHIGAVPFLLKEIDAPVYGTHFTLALLDNKLEEHGLSDIAQLHAIEPRQIVDLGKIQVEWLPVAHSLTSCCAVAITTSVGVVIHSGDFKMDETPVIGRATDLGRLTEYGDRGVLALLADSTNAERPGRTQSERAVVPALERIFEEADQRSVISCFTTSVGVVIHSGDFKMDETPVIGRATDLGRLTEYGDRGVLALLADSTNAERPGRTQSERAVVPALERIFEEADQRIVISCFTTSVHRIQIVLDLAREFGRKVALLGRSMLRNVQTADSRRQLDIPDGLFLSPADARQTDDDRLVLLVAGCQGDPMSAMTKFATDQYKNLCAGPGDTIVLSSRQIPGNEPAISRLISHCYKRGARVIDTSVARVHVSGHASQEDIKILIEATRPKFLIPIHGEHRQLYRHKEWADTLGVVESENIVVIENGDVLELSESRAQIVAKEFVGRTF